MRVQFAVCAQAVTVDRTSNRLSIFNVMDILPVLIFPHVIPAITFVCVVESDQEDESSAKGFFQVLSDGVLVAASEIPINFAENRLARIVLNFQGVPVPKPGSLMFRMTLPNGVVAETQFQVAHIAQNQAIQPATPTTS